MRYLNQVYRRLPVYTGDVSGVCSALYELGGMIVMHDPSGCNSTYNTHDEIRWYEKDSLIFISGLTERDALLGNDEKLISDITAAARDLKPAFITITNSPLPYLIGTDVHAICRTVEEKTGIPTFHIQTNAMHDYLAGAGAAFRSFAEHMLPQPGRKKKKRSALRAVVLGVTPLDFADGGTVRAFRRILEDGGIEMTACWAMGEDSAAGGSLTEALRSTTEADVSLVVSGTGMPTARFLEERYGIPWVAGVPVDGLADSVCTALQNAADSGRSRPIWTAQQEEITGDTVCFLGEGVLMATLAHACALRYGWKTAVICTTENGEEMNEAVRGYHETEIADILAKAGGACGDPMLRRVAPPELPFAGIPHLALSGRRYLKEMPNLLTMKLDAIAHAIQGR